MDTAFAPGHESDGVVGATLAPCSPPEAVLRNLRIRSDIPDPSMCPSFTPSCELVVLSHQFPRSVKRLADADVCVREPHDSFLGQHHFFLFLKHQSAPNLVVAATSLGRFAGMLEGDVLVVRTVTPNLVGPHHWNCSLEKNQSLGMIVCGYPPTASWPELFTGSSQLGHPTFRRQP